MGAACWGGSRGVWRISRTSKRALPSNWTIWADISASHHARILSALEARDAHETQRMLEHHLAESGDLAVEILQEMGYWDRDTGDGATESGAA